MRICGSHWWVVASLCVLSCSGGRDKLLADLQSARPEQRALAVKRLADQGKAEDLVLFTRAAKDPASMVRAEAVAALAQSQDARVVDLLGELLEDPDEEVQEKAAMALAHIKGEKSKAYLTAQYGRRSRSTRLAIVQALKAANVPGAMASVVAAEAKYLLDRNLAALNEGALPVKVAAAEELGKSGRAEAVSRLTPLIKDSQVILAAAAVRGLGFAGERRAVTEITQLLKENFPELRQAASESLLRFGDFDALPQLKEVAVERSSASPLAVAAIIALPRLPEADQALCFVAFEAALPEALVAAREMQRRGGCPLAPLIDALGKGSPSAALLAIQGLGPTAREALSKVLPHLASSDSQIRRLACDAVTAIKDPAALAAIQKLYDQELKVVEALRAEWIPQDFPKKAAPGFEPAAQLSEVPSSPVFVKAGQDDLFRRVDSPQPAKLIRRVPSELIDDAAEEQLKLLASATRALGVLRAPGALDVLKEYILDPSPSMRGAALVGLAGLGTEGIALARIGLLDEEREVQAAVAQALAEQGDAGVRAVLDVLTRLSGDKVQLLEALEHGTLNASAVAPLQVLVQEGGVEAALAARLLGEIKAKDAVPTLVKYLDDSTGIARRDVLQALGKIGDSSAAEAIARDLNHDSPEVRADAAEALGWVGSQAQIEPLDALKGDYYRRVRENAEFALSRIASRTATAEPTK